jgi:DNA repair protein RadD
MTLFPDAHPAAPPALYPHQDRAIELIDESIAGGSRAPLLVQPTGSGKTVVAAAVIRRALERGQKALFLAPRRELVHQASAKLCGIRHGLLLAGADDRIDLYAPVQVASVDTLRSRLNRRKRLALPDFDLVIVDEAHLHVTESRKALLELWPQALRVGLTATPTRRDGRALGLLFDQLIEPTNTAQLTRDGYLAPARYFSLSEPDLARVRTVAGDYNAADLAETMNRPKLTGDIVAHFLKLAPTRRTVLFATSVKHSVALAEEFLRAGVAAEHVDANTPPQMREATFQRFRSGRTQVLCNCFLASYGFDLPELDCVILARPTKSLMLYLQMIGRGLRTSPGKADCLILDHSGAVHRHGLATDERTWTLDGERALVDSGRSAKDRGDSKNLECPECAAVFTGTRLCPECGYFFAPKGKEIKTLAGELIEIGEHLKIEDRDRMAFYLELRGLAAERGFKDGWAANSFREKFGDWPPRSWNSGPCAAPSVDTRRWVQWRAIAWRKSRQGVPA